MKNSDALVALYVNILHDHAIKWTDKYTQALIGKFTTEEFNNALTWCGWLDRDMVSWNLQKLMAFCKKEHEEELVPIMFPVMVRKWILRMSEDVLTVQELVDQIYGNQGKQKERKLINLADVLLDTSPDNPLAFLDQEERLILYQYYTAGMSDRDIAKRHGVKRQEIKKLRFEAIKKLRDRANLDEFSP